MKKDGASVAGRGMWAAEGIYRAGDVEFIVTADAEIYQTRDSTADRFILAKTEAWWTALPT